MIIIDKAALEAFIKQFEGVKFLEEIFNIPQVIITGEIISVNK